MSRGEVGLIVTAMGASTGIFGEPEVAVMVAVVLLTTLLTPIALRSTFNIVSPQDVAEGLNLPKDAAADKLPSQTPYSTEIDAGQDRSTDQVQFRVAVPSMLQATDTMQRDTHIL